MILMINEHGLILGIAVVWRIVYIALFSPYTVFLIVSVDSQVNLI